MTFFILITALLNMAVGFLLAVYLGAAPRYSNPHLLHARRGGNSFVGRLLAFVGRRGRA